MPNHKSAIKRDRQNAKRNAINTTNRSRLRTAIKKLRAAIDSGVLQEAQTALPLTVSVIDKSVQKGVMHRNAAARYKARLTMHVNELKAK
ncbi:MAG: 30S ribosomal protein S20 [Blastocatellia bacterium]|nr:30S ribosomal protein S20 [Blastocatellia bacterium]